MTDEAPQRHAGGRPTKYRPEYVDQARKLCMLGATDVELADFLDIDVGTFYRWRNTHEEFCKAVTCGKDAADDRVERSYYQRAVGYEHESVKIFMPSGATKPVYAPYKEHIPADTGAGLNWLKNRRRKDWSDRQEIALSNPDGTNLTLSDREIAQRIAFALAKGANQPTSADSEASNQAKD